MPDVGVPLLHAGKTIGMIALANREGGYGAEELEAAEALAAAVVQAFLRTRAEESVRRANAELTESDRRKDEFLGMLSHELRNPLAPIRNSIYILELRRSRVDLSLLVRRAGEDHAALFQERGIALSLHVPGEPMWTDADPTRLAQVVGNVLHNAAKFTPRTGRVTLSLEAVRDAAEIHVRDSGIGMEPELLVHVFEPFVQAERTLARTEGGLGLGLALVKGITELHGGSVRGASAGPGQGSEFIVRLPLAAAGAPPS